MGVEHLKPSVKLSFVNPDESHGPVFGPGVMALCRGVQETGSLNAAAKSMGMAYSKAWRVLKETEAALGVQLLVRDGAHGSTLTADCLTLLDAYDQVKSTVIDTASHKTADLLASS